MQSVANKNCWPRTGLYFVYRCDFYYRSRNVYTCLHATELDYVRRLERKKWKERQENREYLPLTLRPFANWKASIFSRDNACNHIVLPVIDACACDGWWTRIVWGAMFKDATACTGSVDDLLLVNVLLVNKEYLQILWNFVTIDSVYFCLSRSEHGDRTNVDRSLIDA